MKSDWINRPNAQYVLAFLRNSNERVRAIRFVMDAIGCSMKEARTIVDSAWHKYSTRQLEPIPTAMGDSPISIMQPGDEN